LIGRRGKTRVTAATPRAGHRLHALAARGQIPQELAAVAIAHHRAQRDADDEILTTLAVTVAALAVGAALGVVGALVAEIEQRGQRGIGLENDRAAVASVTTIRPSARHVCLAPEADTAGTAVAAFDEDVDLVDEHRSQRPRGSADALRAGTPSGLRPAASSGC